MQKVLHVLFHSVPNNNGYSIRSKYIVENLKKSYDVQVLTSSFQKGSEEVETFDSINYHRLSRNSKFIKSELVENLFSIRKKIINLTRKENYDLIHVHSPWIIALPSILAAKKLNIPVIYEVRGAWEDTDVATGKKSESSFKYKIIRKIEEWCMHNATYVVAISKGLKKDMIKRGIEENKITHISNGVSTDRFNPSLVVDKEVNKLKTKYKINSDDIIIGYISSIRKLEGIHNIVEAANKLSNNCRYKYLIVGDGEYREELEKLVHRFNLTDRFIFTGKVNHSEIIQYYSMIDIFVVPRINARVNEIVTPLKPYEAMAMKKPLIVSGVGGLLEIIQEDSTGISFVKDDYKDLAKKIDYLAKNKEYRSKLGNNARTFAEKYYDWTVVTMKYHGIYNKIIQ